MTQHIIKKIFLTLVFTCLAPNIIAFTEEQQAMLIGDITVWLFLQPNLTDKRNNIFRKRLFEQLWNKGLFEYLGFDKSNAKAMNEIKSKILSTIFKDAELKRITDIHDFLTEKHLRNPIAPATLYILWVTLISQKLEIRHEELFPLVRILCELDSSSAADTFTQVEECFTCSEIPLICLPHPDELEAFKSRRLCAATTTDRCAKK